MANSNIPIFAVASYGNIQSYVNDGKLTYPSYVFCKDKNTMVFIDKNLQIQDINGFNQSSIIEVEELPTENIQSNTFYICNGKGHLLINNVLVPVFKELTTTESSLNNYDQLENLPVVNKYGEISSPIVLFDLENGSYSIKGQYKVGGNIETVYVSSKDVTVLVDSDEEYKYITKISTKEICQYTFNLETQHIDTDKYATQSWILARGYATETYVNQAIKDLYNKIAEETLVTITKVSQLENDMGYLTVDNFNEVEDEKILNLF